MKLAAAPVSTSAFNTWPASRTAAKGRLPSWKVRWNTSSCSRGTALAADAAGVAAERAVPRVASSCCWRGRTPAAGEAATVAGASAARADGVGSAFCCGWSSGTTAAEANSYYESKEV